ncbi:MAG: murein biosynthesis integral membrane protein MurJ [Verrucomicrobia bacterium]|nr:murein biosynthesis integral membrane protein MurJ [Verrucomicrobiota bacterium]
MNAESNDTSINPPAVTRNPQSSMIRSTGAVGVATMTSRVLGLAREMIFASFMGQGLEASAFFYAFTIPNLFRRLLGEGALSAAFVPLFAERLHKEGKEAAWRAANAVASAVSVILVAIAVLFVGGLLLALVVLDMSAGNRLIVRLTATMFPYMVFICLAGLAMGVLNSMRHFFVPAFSPVLMNLVLIGSVFVLCPLFGTTLDAQVMGLAVGVLFGGVVQLAYQLPQLWREGWRPCWSLNWRDENLRQVGKLLAPSVIGVVAYQINVIVARTLGFLVGDYVPAALNNADRLMELPLGVFSVSLATYMLPTLSSIAARGAMEEFRLEIGRALRFLMVVTVPATVGLIVLSEPIVRLLFERGRFDAASTWHCAYALEFTAVGLAFYSSTSILARGFYALKDTRTPMIVALCTMGANLVFSLCLMWPLKEGGLALANSLSAVLNSMILFVLLSRRLGTLHGRSIALAVVRVSVSAFIMAAACWGAHHWLAGWLTPTTLAHNLALVFGPIAVGGVVYFAAAWMLAREEVRAILHGFRHG